MGVVGVGVLFGGPTDVRLGGCTFAAPGLLLRPPTLVPTGVPVARRIPVVPRVAVAWVTPVA